MKMTLPIKFSLVSLVITLVSLSFVTLFTFKASEKLLNDQAIRKINESIHLSTRLFDFQISQVTKDIHFLMHSNEMRRYIDHAEEHSSDKISHLFATILNQREMYFQIRIIGMANQGKELIRTYRKGERIRNVPKDALTPKSQRSYFQKGILLSAETVAFAPITLNKEHGKPTFPYISTLRGISPIYDGKELFGLLIINVDLKKLTDSVFQQHKNTSYFITNKDGDYLIHSDPSKAMAFDLGNNANVLDDYPSMAHVFQTFKPMAGGRNMVVDYVDDDKLEILALDHLHLSFADKQHSFLTLGGVSSTLVARHESISLRNQMMTIFTMVIFIIVLVTFLLARKLTKPIEELTEKALLFSKGDHAVNFNTKGSDEVAQLSQAMKMMLAHLAASRGELAELNISLENQIKVRTSELEYALDQAEEAMQTKGRFLAMMSHEIRTPLNGVLGLTELVLDSDLSAEQRDNLETILSSGETLLTILNDVLDYSKMEAGQFKLNNIPFDINELIEHITKLYVKTAHQSNVELICQSLPLHQHCLIGDPDRLRQIMMNLLGNAIKFTHEGEILCGVSLLEDAGDHVHLLFEVKDTGIGMSKEVQSRLFGDFVQADSSTTRKYGGTGLGLSIAQNLADLMGSEIRIESEEGKGSRFYFVLRLAKGALIPERCVEKLRGVSLLVVDDNHTNRSVLQQMATSWGMQVTTVEHGEEGLHVLQQQAYSGNPYQLVLLDHIMPDLNGLSFAKQAYKLLSAAQKPKVILMSSIDHAMDTLEKEKLGIDAFLRKPAYQTLLLDTIQYVLSEPSETKALVTPKPTVPMFKKAKLLLVEDVAVNQQIALGMLKKLGICAVDVAHDGIEALQYFNQSTYDLILMDIQMPKMDGHTACRAMRDIENSQSKEIHTAIIALTAHAFAEDISKSKEAGMDDHLTKPLTGSKLQEVLARWLPLAKQKPYHDVEIATPNSTEDSPKSIDQAVLKRLHHDMGGGIGMILDAWTNEMPSQLSAFATAMTQQDADALRRSAHRLKGSSRNLGATQLGNLCAKLETDIQAGGIAQETESLIKAIVAEAGLVCKTLDESWVKELH